MNWLQKLRAKSAGDDLVDRFSVLGGISTSSGEVINPDTALQLSTVWACTRILAESVAHLPIAVYERTSEGKRPAPKHPLYRVLHDEPNPDMSAIDFRMAMMVNCCPWGNAYARITRNNGRVIGLWPLRAPLMKVRRDAGRLIYEYTENGVPVQYAASEIFHLRTMSMDGVMGMSPVVQARDAFGLAKALERYGAEFFANGAVPLTVLEHPGQVGEEGARNLRKWWETFFSGRGNRHKVAIMEEGMKASMLAVDPQKAQALEQRHFQIEEIARIFRVPLHMIGELTRSTNNNITMQSLEFVIYTLLPWLEIWEQAINRSLLSESEKSTYFVEHSVEGLLRGDTKSRYEAYAVGRQWGWLSVNDIRRLENMNPVAEGGDTYLQPLNMVDAANPPSLSSTDTSAASKMAALLRAA